MLRLNKIVLWAGLLVCLQGSMVAQNSTASPYTRFGYGMIADRSFGAGRSMGGIGYGLRSSKQINPMNPASYSSMDSLTFLFDVGASLQLSLLNNEENSHRNLNGNLMYLAMQFPLSDRIAMSAGLLPYSHTGYTMSVLNEKDEISHMDTYSGKGGLNDVYLGLSIDIWKKRLALGANISYMFGTIEHNSAVSYYGGTQSISNLYTTQKVNLRNFKFDVGLQYTHPLSKTERLIFGTAFSPGIKLSAVNYDIISSDAGVLSADTVHNLKFNLPNTLGIGVSYEKDYKLLVAADLTWQEWSKAHFGDYTEDFKDRLKFIIGGEYIPNNFTRQYLSRVRYRAGFHYSNSYLRFNGLGYNEYGVSIGAGFPMIDNRSFINTSFEYVKVAPEAKSLINEQYFRFTLSFTFNEFWFFKLRMD